MKMNQRGVTLVETLLALMLITIAMMAALVYCFSAMQGTRHNKDKDFAIQKAIAILEEMKGVVEQNDADAGGVLDGFDDGATTTPMLTIEPSTAGPAYPGSGNVMVDTGRWKFERQISVQKFPSLQTSDVRLVNVRVYGWDSGQQSLLAEVSSVIQTIADRYPPTQVYDVYCLAVANVPGWWVYMANLVPFVERAIDDLESRNPGLEFRTRWVRTLSYGRDQEYLPSINAASSATSDIDEVYFYPGLMESGSAVSSYYVANQFGGRISIDGTETNGYDATTNPLPYALADQYNHAMRYPDELALFNARVAAGLEDPAVPTLRILMEDMYSDPAKYENALIINLHGELFPFPPVRNYSDAAKDPAGRPNVRVVTHAEQLRYDNSDDVNLRVYSYLTDPTDSSLPDALDAPITVVIKGAGSLPGLTVSEIEGGLDLAPVDSSPDSYSLTTGDATSSYSGDMYYDVAAVSGGVRVRLYNSPLRTPCAGAGCGGGGLEPEKRLYGMEYIPTPLSNGSGDFSRNLTDGGNMTKNTARWIITLPDADLPDNAMITIETRVDDDLTTGVLFPTRNEPTNLSKTYAWRGSDLWVFGDGTDANPPNLPLTERFQFLGDPRHNPYADLKNPYHSTNNPLGDGYNRYFDDFHNGAGGNKAADANYWPGFGAVKNDSNTSNDGWDNGSDFLEIDVNRIFQTLRASVMRPRTVFTTMTGWSYYYVGIGNEIGYDGDNGFPNSIHVSSKPYTGAGGSRWEQSITDAVISGNTGGVKYVRENVGSNYWWSLNWLGELYPDSSYTDWSSDGNLPTGSGSNLFIRDLRSNINVNLPTGTTFQNVVRRTNQPGCTTFFSTGTTGSKFHHQGDGSGTGSLTAQGAHIGASYGFKLPPTVSINRPFNINLNGDGPVPDGFQDPAYGTAGLGLTKLADYYNHSRGGMLGSAALELTGSGTDTTFVAVNGISNTQLTGSAFMGKWAFLTLVHTFLEAGLSTGAGRIPQVPRIAITDPNDLTDLTNPSSISIQWNETWKRWDGQPYTPNYSSTFTEATPTSYTVMYSDDGGTSWKHVQDDSAATPGTRPPSAYLQTSTSYSLSTSATKFPKGSYLLRVEAYRDDVSLHYAYHQNKIYIKR
jgi:type II secretory pathway pseudopilin PulG